MNPTSEAPLASKYSTADLLIKVCGILFIVGSVFIVVFVPCPTNGQYFVIYSLIGLGIALMLAKSADKSKANFRIKNVKIVLAGGVALPFILYFTNPIGSFKPDNCGNIGITVFVYGKNGLSDLVLKDQGKVAMHIGGEVKKSSINDNGQAFFQNLHDGSRVTLGIDFSEPYHPVHKDSIYTIKRDSNIYLQVALDGIGNVQGMVLFDNAPLANVIVKLIGKNGFLLDTTNQTGDFHFNIPDRLQLSNYQVWFIKNGFRAKMAPAYPETGQPLNIIMERR